MPLLKDWEIRAANGEYEEISRELNFKGELVGYSGSTTKIIGYDPQEQAFVSEDHNFFRLREPHPAYEASFPSWQTKLNNLINNRLIRFLQYDLLLSNPNGK